MIDQIVEAAYKSGAENQPVQLADLFSRFRSLYPALKGVTEESYGATLGFHTINATARWNREIPLDRQVWVLKPFFKRTRKGLYVLLNDEELTAFYQALAAKDRLLETDEFDVDLLTRRYPG